MILIRNTTILISLLALVIIYLTGFVHEIAKLKFEIMAPSWMLYWVLLKGLYLLLGVVIEGNSVIVLFKHRLIKMNWILLGIFLILLTLSFFPADLTIVFGPHPLLNAFSRIEVVTALNILAGIFLVRSFVDLNNDRVV
ncbi:hypothetical protein [Paenibacillus thermotolerans]|uniref:hypothetical protein n=1 Tax=Paenibacillus thermotolerans TaxID=3027807 RepID=UPI00236813F1|nr:MULTISPECIES: hypothetical protein [unclassified Paenibacillus]